MKKIRILLMIFSICLTSCINREKIVDKSKLLARDYRLYQKTPAWEFAKAVEDSNIDLMDKILSKEPYLIDYREPQYGGTLLMLTVLSQNYKSFKYLINKGANIHLYHKRSGNSAILFACKFSRKIKFLEYLVEHGAKINDVQQYDSPIVRTPLMVACMYERFDIVKYLVEKGVDVNYLNPYRESAFSEAYLSSFKSSYKIVLYLIDHGADYTKPIVYLEDKNRYVYILESLRKRLEPLNSRAYKEKMEIVSFLKTKGLDYASEPIPSYIQKEIKKEYPNTWKEYMEKY
ncbi:ankyrin repeat domain-containing protein [Marinilabiliaceae bacterium JC040]|nr:ankyrin repeat domain-containing protein [Marinilabiliaceae bacterium JC040]